MNDGQYVPPEEGRGPLLLLTFFSVVRGERGGRRQKRPLSAFSTAVTIFGPTYVMCASKVIRGLSSKVTKFPLSFVLDISVLFQCEMGERRPFHFSDKGEFHAHFLRPVCRESD